jgi:hypothetical protein
VSARACRIDQQRGEALHPPEDRDVVDLDAPFGEQLFDVPVRQRVAQVQRTVIMITPGGNRNPANPRPRCWHSGKAATHQPSLPSRTSTNATVPMAEAGISNKGLAAQVRARGERDGYEISADHVSVRRWLGGSMRTLPWFLAPSWDGG